MHHNNSEDAQRGTSRIALHSVSWRTVLRGIGPDFDGSQTLLSRSQRASSSRSQSIARSSNSTANSYAPRWSPWWISRIADALSP